MCCVLGAKESGDEEEEDAEQETHNDDAAAAVLGRGHRNALLANRTRVSVMSLAFSCLLHNTFFVKNLSTESGLEHYLSYDLFLCEI